MGAENITMLDDPGSFHTHIGRDAIRIWRDRNSTKLEKVGALLIGLIPGIYALCLVAPKACYSVSSDTPLVCALVTGWLVSVGILAFAIVRFRRRGSRLQEIIITSDGVSTAYASGSVQRYPWTNLDTVNFHTGIMTFAGGGRLRLKGRIRLDPGLIAWVLGPETRFGQAWDRYLATPQPRRGLIRCQSAVGGE